MNEMSEKPWTEKHQREARARLYEIAAVLIREGAPEYNDARESRPNAMIALYYHCEHEREFRCALRNNSALDDARVDREVRRVRALAEGRLVRETTWQARHVGGTSPLAECDTRAALDAWITRGYIAAKLRVVRVTRIRRAS